jgi:hypothetical protein
MTTTRVIRHRVRPVRPVRPVLSLAAITAFAILTAAPLTGAVLNGNPDLEKAIALEAQAEGYNDDVTSRAKAAALYREAASYRPDADPQKVQNLRMAARLSFHAGKEGQAMADAEAAGRLATRTGDILEAGHSWLDAAWIAVHLDRQEAATTFIANARLLAGSPFLGDEDRAELLERIAD